ncbi:MAG: FAD-dependent oxidoreductase [Gammaproteobacteria bacterium]|jgi:3-phenylpropionate/trans-cinnamate dioxygenase ferredoxin reductase subunit|nr:FAD-dependent oxidoreductase [Gammaproteobacteria bacterium]MBT5332393.1 FAD-dependent oxidoreductase [Gammaproteobacteria bacterium]MBT5681001.1 FAD-dependent oxidoreductase [Gammaproteobacteria bacterium]MBT6024793.1 FAD-dependent oxidoreductase [Gammaproteobacteria bacterium]MBT6559546.1 FAD-dependent oxidoreductase [Gammaproteobacteria bacterium]
MTGIVIIGAGHAAGQAAASLRQAKFEGPITIIGDEAHVPYQRPPLSKQYLAGTQLADKVYLRAEKFYADKDIQLMLDTRATQIDPSTKTINLDNGETIAYEKLLISTGSRPRKLSIEGSDLSGIHYLRTMDDVDGIRADVKPGANLVIVGGGYIGLEVAAVGIELGMNVHVLEMEERILQRVTTPEMSAYYHKLHTDRGVHIHTQTGVTGFSGNSSVEKVLCGDESFDADIVIVGIGIIPNIEIAEEAGIHCDNGIVVDDHCRTSDPDIYAAGDCTNHPNPLMNKRLRLESVPNAMDQARVSTANMLGDDKVYAAIPWFWSDQYDLKLQMVGFSADGDSQVLRGDMDTHQFAIFYLKDGKVVAADAVNSPKEFMLCKQLVGKPADPAKLADPETDLKSLLA